MNRTGRWPILTVCLLVVSPTAWADGGFFPQFAGSAQSADQRAIVVYDAGREVLILQTAYDGDKSDFAWVIPVPQLPKSGDISTVSAHIFEDLYYLTEPALYGHYGYNACGVFGCSSSSKSQQYQSVRVWETLQVDDYDIAILSAGESSDLVGWLNANGYAYPAGHQDELDYYVDKSSFFVAAKISPTVAEDNGAQPPPGLGDGYRPATEPMRPLRLCFDTPEPVYPLRISAVSSTDEVEVLLYVIARHRVTSPNYNTEQVELTSDFRGGDFPAYYEQQFRHSLAQAGAGSLLVEYAGALPDYLISAHGADLGLGPGDFFVTRLRSYLEQDDMQEDVVMTQAGSDDEFAIRVAAVVPAHTNLRLAGIGLFFALAAVFGLVSGDARSLIRALLIATVVALLVL